MQHSISKRLSPRRVMVALALCLGLATSGCYMTPRTFSALTAVAATAVYAAAIVGTVAVLAHHDAHFHYETCGHYRRWHQGRWVYQYSGHWEYYDSHSGRWYYYAE